MRLGITEILLILVLALVIFGGSKLSGVGKALEHPRIQKGSRRQGGGSHIRARRSKRGIQITLWT